MADKPQTVNQLPPAYPSPSATSDMPPAGTPAAESVPLAGQAPDPEPEPEPQAQPEPEPVADGKPRRGRPSKADRELAELRSTVAELTNAVTALAKPASGAPEPKPPAAPVRPKRADFDDPEAYDDALIEYASAAATAKATAATEAARTAREAETAQQSQETENARIVREWNGRRQAAAEKYEDYEEIAENADTPMTMPMMHAIVNSEHGPDIAYWLGQHRDEAARIAATQNPIRQALAIGRIEASFVAADKTAPQPKEPEPVTTQAPVQRTTLPAPIRPVRPQSQPVDQVPTEQNSEDRIGRMLAELRKANQPMGWGTPGAGRA